MGMYTNLADVNAALKDGDVVIDGNWQPQDVTNSYRTLTIPANRTLQINGDFDANKTPQFEDMIVNGATGSCLIVNGEYFMNASQNTVNYEIVADDLDIDCDPAIVTVDVNSNVTVEGDLNLRGELTVNFNGNVQIGGDVTDENNTTMIQVNVYGTTNVAGDTYDQVAWNVFSAHSLNVNGEVKGSLTLGSSEADGYAEIGTMTGKLILVNGELVVTDALNSKNIDLKNAKDVTVTLEAGIEIGEDVADVFTDADGYEISGDALEDQVFTVKGSGEDAKLATDKTTGLKVLMDAMNYEYTQNKYTYKGDVSVNDNTVTFTYGAAAVNRDNFMNDVSRFLGALVYAGEQTEEVTMTIVYDSETYKWDNDASSKGSKWHSGDEYFAGTGEDEDKSQSNTLIYHIFGTTTEQTEDMEETLIKADFPDRIELTVGGESVIIVRQ